MKKKALVFIDTDVAIRHFIKNTTFSKLSEAYEIIYVFNNDKTTDKSSVNTPLDSLGLKNIRYTTVPRRRTGKWYFLFAATVLRQQRGLPNYTARKRQLVQSLGSRNVFLLLILGLPVIYPIFKFIFEQLMGIDSSVRGIIEDERPDIVIHPSVLNGYYINELLLMKRKSGLPLCLLMNSWDNPSAKAVATGIPDFMAVWGEQSKQQALDYMKIPSKNLEIFGAAQFQIYRSAPEESIKELYDFHKKHNNLGTVTAVRPPSRFGELNLEKDGTVSNLEEKPQMHKGLINGGFFVFKKKVMNYLDQSEECDFEFGPLQEISNNGDLMAYRHEDFWQCMDNVRERDYLDKLIGSKSAPWIKW